MRISIFDIDAKYLRFLPGVASLLYFLPGIISTIIIIYHLIVERDTNHLIVNFWFLLSFAIFNLLTAIGLYKRNIIAWWSAIIYPITIYVCVLYSLLYYMQGDHYSKIGPIAVLSVSIMMVAGIYYSIGLIIVIIPEVKMLFRKTAIQQDDTK